LEGRTGRKNDDETQNVQMMGAAQAKASGLELMLPNPEHVKGNA